MKKLLFNILLLAACNPYHINASAICPTEPLNPDGTIASYLLCYFPDADTLIMKGMYQQDPVTFATIDLQTSLDYILQGAQKYENLAALATDPKIIGDLYSQAATAYIYYCNTLLNNSPDLDLLQSGRTSALQDFDRAFGAYLQMVMENLTDKNVRLRAKFMLSQFLVNLQSVISTQQNLVNMLGANTGAAIMIPSSSDCNPWGWYPLQLPGQDTSSNCSNKKHIDTLCKNLLANTPLSVQSHLYFGPNSNITMMNFLGTPGQQILGESLNGCDAHTNACPAVGGLTRLLSHPRDLTTSSLGGTYCYAPSGTVSASPTPAFDAGYGFSFAGGLLSTNQIGGISPSQVLDPYPAAQFPQVPQAIFAFPQNTTPIFPQTLHDAIRDYMYSADIHAVDSYLYNQYATTIAPKNFPSDVLPALQKMRTARINALQAYEGAMIKIFKGLTNTNSLSPSVWSNPAPATKQWGALALQCIAPILSLFSLMVQQIASYDINIFNKL